MKKIFKKSLALMVSAALCLTAFVGCLTVNAETPSNTATLTVGSKEITQGTTTVTVPVTLQANDTTEIAAARFSLVIDSSVFTFTDVIDNCVVVPDGANYDVGVTTNDGSYPAPTATNGSTYIFLVEGTTNGGDGTDIVPFSTATFDLVLTVKADAAADTYNFAGYEGEDPKVAILEACNQGKVGTNSVTNAIEYGPEEAIVIATPTFGSVTIKAAHTHSYTVLKYDKTNHWYECPDDGKKDGLEAHTFGEWVVDVEATTTKEGSKHRDCSVCKYSEIATIPVIEHTHTWDAGVMTTMPTYNTPGIVTYTCSGCSETKTEEVMSISGNTIVLNSSSTKVDVPTARLRYGVAVYPAVFSGIAAAGGNVTSRGMLFTTDGTVPEFGNDNIQVLSRADATNSTNGSAFYGGYVGMNLEQMGWTLKFRAFVQFTYNGAECYYYGPIYENSFMNAISANEDAQSVALKNLYSQLNDENVTDISEKCSTYGTTVAESQHANIVTNSNSTYFEMKSFRVRYGTAIYPVVFSGAPGTVTERGMLFTTDGNVPEYGNDGVQVLSKADATNSTNGAAFYAGYVGMNLEQIGYKLTFRPYVKYTDADGADAYIYGAAVQFTYIDILRSLSSTNELALAIVDYYDTYIVPAE